MKEITAAAQSDLVKLHSGNPWVELLDIELPADFTPQSTPVNEYRFLNQDPVGRWHVLLTNAHQDVCQPANGWQSARLADDDNAGVMNWRTFCAVPYVRDEMQDSNDESGLVAARISLGDAAGVIRSIMDRTAGMVNLRVQMELAMAGRYTNGAYAVMGEDAFLVDDDVDVTKTTGSFNAPGNYAIVNGRLYHLAMAAGLPVLTQVGVAEDWTLVDGLYDPDEEKASAYGIRAGALYALAGATATAVDAGPGWTLVYGRHGWAGVEFAIGIKDGSLFLIDGTSTPAAFGTTGDWTAVSGGLYEHDGDHLYYPAIRGGALYKIWKPAGAAAQTALVDAGPGWAFVIGSFDPAYAFHAAYAVKAGDLYRVDGSGITLVDSGNGAWTCLKGSMVRSYVCGVVGIRAGSLVMAMGEPEYFKIVVDSSKEWTDAYCNESLGEFYAYAIGDGELYGIDLALGTDEEGYYYIPIVTRIGTDGGWLQTGAPGDKTTGSWGAINLSVRRLESAPGGEEAFGENFLACLESEIVHDFQVMRSTHDRTRFSVELSSYTPLNRRFPPRVMLKAMCPWVFKSPECGYVGAETACDRTIADCRERNNINRIGCFPGCGSGGLAQ